MPTIGQAYTNNNNNNNNNASRADYTGYSPAKGKGMEPMTPEDILARVNAARQAEAEAEAAAKAARTSSTPAPASAAANTTAGAGAGADGQSGERKE